jgi:integrase
MLFRRRRVSANRLFAILKAALNYAYRKGRISTDNSWRRVKPFRESNASVIRYLTATECVRLVNACDPAFRNLVRGALVTGCRYGELARMQVADFNADIGTITVRISKSGKPRHVALNDDGQKLFTTLTVGHAPEDLIFLRNDGLAWGNSHQQLPLEKASRIAKVYPPATFHILRHT